MRTFSSAASRRAYGAPRRCRAMDAPTIRPGDEIAPGLRPLRLLGGGLRYHAYIAHSEHLRALVVVKLVRDELVEDDAVLAGLRGEPRGMLRPARPSDAPARLRRGARRPAAAPRARADRRPAAVDADPPPTGSTSSSCCRWR